MDAQPVKVDGGWPGCRAHGLSHGSMAHSGPLQVYADASLVFPLLVAETFAQKADAFRAEARCSVLSALKLILHREHT